MMTPEELAEQEEWQAEIREAVKWCPWLQFLQWVKDYEDRYGEGWRIGDMERWIYDQALKFQTTAREVNQNPIMDWFKYPVNEISSYSKFCLWIIHDLMRLGWVERVNRRHRLHSISSEGFDALGDVDTVLTCNAFRDRVQEIGCLNERISGTAMRKHIYEFLTVAWENWINESFDCDYLLSGYPDNWDNMRSALLN